MNTYFTVSNLNQMSALEVHRIYKLRVDVFVNEQQCPYAEIDDTDALPDTLHIRANDRAGALAGYARIHPDIGAGFRAKCGGGVDIGDERVLWQFGRFCLAPGARGTGLGAEIMKDALKLAKEQNPGADVALTAQTALRDYYESYGFRVCGDEFDWDGMTHLPMLRPAH
ncbi:GNAT family N-acetyltransferase [Corynebacterium antarcticum]|uniref:GNAT family N-acetyltransferase n=1 Tax=Corynebacterium antarcticum TaxID=2800405 RepID=UPI00200443AA|nr:GNAT family N-acetyltransferase [Corynebacterium antarcticum]MCK7661799.1 GNAT family N-acetyltransferase [Corynebacterium antarcticum]